MFHVEQPHAEVWGVDFLGRRIRSAPLTALAWQGINLAANGVVFPVEHPGSE